MERLDKRLANTGRWSRKEVRELCRSGRVSVDGRVERRPETKVADEALLAVDGVPVDGERLVWIMLHKPAGLVSATEDAREATVLSLLPERYRRMGLFPVGRLDKDTEGLLLLTNDGPLAHALLSPRRHVDKVYYAETDGVPDQQDAAAFAAGMTLADGTACRPAGLTPLGGGRCIVTLHEGKYHQVKRMLAARGKPVTYLRRVRFGPLALDDGLPAGGWRLLTGEERRLLETAGE